LHEAGIPVISRGVVFAWQLWNPARAVAARAGTKRGASAATVSGESQH
jgi:hypothetical protein